MLPHLFPQGQTEVRFELEVEVSFGCNMGERGGGGAGGNAIVVGTTEGFAPIKKLNKESLYPLPLKSLHKEQTSYLFNQAL